MVRMKNILLFCLFIVFTFIQNACVQKIASCPGDVFSTNIINELATTDSQCTSEKEEEEKKNLLYALLFVAASSSSSGSSSGDSSDTSILSEEETNFHTLLNEHRTSVGCSTLTLHSGLTTVARNHSGDMATNNYFAHDSQDGTTFSQRITNAGISYTSAAENIAAGNPSASDTLEQWLNSSGHKANIENCKYTHHGIGRAYNSSSTYDYYWTNVFAQDPSGE